ncbi:MAG: PAS domain-containing protein, partial [Acidimicrobiales bacterium]
MPPDPQALLDALPDPVVAIDAEGRVLWVNAAGEEQLGWNRREIVGTSGMELIHPDDMATALTALVSVQDKSLGTPVELRVRDRDAGFRLVELRGRSALDVRGVDAIVLVLRDITERRRWEVS